jgi:putative phosphoribosyl transferase
LIEIMVLARAGAPNLRRICRRDPCMRFVDRTDAGRRLAALLAEARYDAPVVLALPRGGVPVAAEIARRLQAPLDLILARKIGLPGQPELAIGAVVDWPAPVTVRNEPILAQTGVTAAAFCAVRADELAEIKRRHARYLGKRAHPTIADRTAIVVDDGIATGATMLAALRAVREAHPRRLVLAVPVAPVEILHDLAAEADDVVCLHASPSLRSVGEHYEDFRQLTDSDVVALLAETASPAGTPA